ncbi:MAG TPA: PAS domain-containing protein [Planctomycetota bacterium]|nr:PAS domain-containing protein [Planctomycetota bacterium]
MPAATVRILLAEPALAVSLADRLRKEGGRVEEATGALDAQLSARRRSFAAAVVPARRSLAGGERLLDALAREFPRLPIVAVGPRDAGEILAALRAGARDYLVEGEEDPVEAASRVLRAARFPAGGAEPEPGQGPEEQALRLALADARREVAERTDAFRELQEIFRHDLERMLLVFERIGEGILFADRAGAILVANPASAAWLAGGPYGAVGAPLAEAFSDPVLREAVRVDRVRALRGERVERFVTAGDGRRVRIETLPEDRGGGEAEGTLTILRDLTVEVQTSLLPLVETPGSLP